MTDPSGATGTIVVGGTGRVSVQPDVAELRLGIAISRATVKEARAAAAAAMAAVLAAIDGAGVARADVRTTLLSVRHAMTTGKTKGPDLSATTSRTWSRSPSASSPASAAAVDGRSRPERPVWMACLPARGPERGRTAARAWRGGRRGPGQRFWLRLPA